jgi:hypothetical protein
MAKQKSKLPPIVRLTYKPGETIIKGGDFGISIYLIVKGKVEVYIESQKGEISLATIGPGEMMGEMIFLTGNTARRTASVRAVEPTVLEAWHPRRISEEYGAMPLVVRYIVNQVIARLTRMNRMINELESVKAKEKSGAARTGANERKFFRKAVNIECMYRPLDDKGSRTYWGEIKDMSKAGMLMQVPDTNAARCSHKPGDEFMASAFLPNSKRIDLQVKIAKIYDAPEKNVMSIGLVFFDLSESAKKKLGFFLMG